MRCAGITNVAFPALLLCYALSGGQLSVAACGKALLCTLAAGLVAKLTVEGSGTLPQYPKARSCSTAGAKQAALKKSFEAGSSNLK